MLENHLNLSVFIAQSLFIGMGATAIMDLWALMLKTCFNIPSLNYGLVGRWLSLLPKGQFVHTNIAKTTPTKIEAVIGWLAHYFIGVVFAAALLLIVDATWLAHPTLKPALLVAVVTLAFPFFIMQPGMGLGIAASKTPKPNTARMRSFLAHLSFGFGLYGFAIIWTLLN